jgi:lipopolysaccharide export system protein LptA
VRFDSNTGAASTDREASFKFDRGEGKSVGARYDPTTQELQMHQNVSLTWFGEKPEAARMEIEAGSLVYKEAESKVVLTPWTKFRRGTLSVEGGNSIITLLEGAIQNIEAFQARGVDAQPKRNVEFAAEWLRMQFTPKGAVQGLVGENNARLVSTSPGAQTTITSTRVDLEFDSPDEESVLKKALATRGAVIEAKPLPVGGAPVPETRVMRSDVIALYMRDKGEEIDRVETESPGTVEFIPNRRGQKKRVLTGERLYMRYGAANQIQSFRAYKVSTRTEPEQAAGKPPLPPALTWSNELAAEFDQKTGVLDKLDQWENFRYQEGERQARAQRASLVAPKDEITLSGAARIWDSTGSTAADSILMNQKSGDFAAMGNVNSTRMPEKKKQAQPGMLSNDEPLHAKAERMNSTGENSNIVYEGAALMWQGANRLQADRISINRQAGNLISEGHVVSQLLDRPDANKKTAVFTVVKAPRMTYSERMTYSDKERIAHYTGGAVLTRGATVVKAREIKAFLKQGEDSSLDRAVADGSVKIEQKTPQRTRTGSAEHAEYFTADGRVLLTGGSPEFIDSIDGATRGKKLTYFSNNDRLLVEGAQGQPVESKLLRK